MSKLDIISEYSAMDREELLHEYYQNYIVSKNKDLLLADLDRAIGYATEKKYHFAEVPDALREKYLALMAQFRESVKEIELPSFPGCSEPWYYAYIIDELGAHLYLRYIKDLFVEDEAGDDDDEDDGYVPEIVTDYGPSFELLTVPAKMLSPDEFGKLYGVSEITVRQWIRRGKIRAVVKNGNTWLISELAEIDGKLHEGTYYWNETPQGLPEEYKFMEGHKGLSILRSKERKGLFDIFIHGNFDAPVAQMETRDKEKFELFLLTHPQITHPVRNWLHRD